MRNSVLGLAVGSQGDAELSGHLAGGLILKSRLPKRLPSAFLNIVPDQVQRSPDRKAVC
jgi:hypothetical protein